MRRVVTVGVLGVSVAIALVSEALAAPNASVDDRVKQDEAMHVSATNCDSTADYTAYVDIIVRRADGTVYSVKLHATDNDRATPEAENVTMRETGTFTVQVRCRHEFNNGNRGTWYDETEETLVTGLTDDERKRCKKKRTKKARRRCLRRERAD